MRRARPDPADPVRGRGQARLGRPARRLRHRLPDVRADRGLRRPRPVRRADQAAHPVRVLARHGQQQRHAGRPLGGHRVDPGSSGRVHLGVLGPRHSPACERRKTAGRGGAGLYDNGVAAPGHRWAYGGDFGETSPRRGVHRRRAWCSRTARPSRRCTSTGRSRRRSRAHPLVRPRPRRVVGAQPAALPGSVLAVGGVGLSRWTARTPSSRPALLPTLRAGRGSVLAVLADLLASRTTARRG